ncbi:MAG: sulfatase [Lentisphaerae bacterium]|nr:sulfatase [Lentisphaerota bacterium]
MHKQPNILLAIADDLAWPHLSAYGCRWVATPAADRVAREGVLFTNGYTAAPTCTASRAALLTGRYPWQLEEGCQLWGLLPSKYEVYPDLLEAAGYFIGMTYKGWGPGSIEASGRTRNPAGPAFNSRTCKPLTTCMSTNDYPANFADFLDQKPDGRPFCFWYGAKEPHRAYDQGSGLRHGKRLADVDVPAYLPDCDEVRSDFLDYALEVERFDRDLGAMLELLDRRGELDDTIVVVTGDNGCPFPRAKATLYQHGCHVPLAVRWGRNLPAGRTVTDFVSFIDIAPTLLEAAGVDAAPLQATGRSFLDVLRSPREGRVDPARCFVQTGRERHAYCRPHNLGNPMRALVTDDWLYIRNFTPDRLIGDVDPSPTQAWIESRRDAPDMARYHALCFGPRPAEELYVAANGPDCTRNVAGEAEHADALQDCRRRLERLLREQGDPRILGRGWFFECVPYYTKPGPGRIEGFPPIEQRHYQRGNLPPGEPLPPVNAADAFAVWS